MSIEEKQRLAEAKRICRLHGYEPLTRCLVGEAIEQYYNEYHLDITRDDILYTLFGPDTDAELETNAECETRKDEE